MDQFVGINRCPPILVYDIAFWYFSVAFYAFSYRTRINSALIFIAVAAAAALDTLMYEVEWVGRSNWVFMTWSRGKLSAVNLVDQVSSCFTQIFRNLN